MYHTLTQFGSHVVMIGGCEPKAVDDDTNDMEIYNDVLWGQSTRHCTPWPPHCLRHGLTLQCFCGSTQSARPVTCQQ